MKTNREKEKKEKLVEEVANQLYQFNWENKKYVVSDTFEVDGKKYSIQKELMASLKRKGYVSLVKLMQSK
jgi:hypothetical protein